MEYPFPLPEHCLQLLVTVCNGVHGLLTHVRSDHSGVNRKESDLRNLLAELLNSKIESSLGCTVGTRWNREEALDRTGGRGDEHGLCTGCEQRLNLLEHHDRAKCIGSEVLKPQLSRGLGDRQETASNTSVENGNVDGDASQLAWQFLNRILVVHIKYNSLDIFFFGELEEFWGRGTVGCDNGVVLVAAKLLGELEADTSGGASNEVGSHWLPGKL
ncbi:hypothetical protein OGAPHI_004905 [Ogataea philodendri]|uniref:Uncharacterized protein n=1 Tax=Ogataea philodendri TaxID=1378263 RepID=A0A9P8P1S2_9ASCO|nr:uncharacterized protein OGAPHI_004905 [Ogataea philodendri]KAH3663504.1 hypothetical protein OGAPHI_004905 [Ogataea philodendri]